MPRVGRGNRWEIGAGQVLFLVGTEVPFLTVPTTRLDYPAGHPNLWVWVAVTWDYSGSSPWVPLTAEIGAGTSLPADYHETQYLPVARLLGHAVFPLTAYGPLVVSPPDSYALSTAVRFLPSPSGASKTATFSAGLHVATDGTQATAQSSITTFRPDGTTAVVLSFAHGELHNVEETPSGGSPTGYARAGGRYQEQILSPGGAVTLWFVNGRLVQRDGW